MFEFKTIFDEETSNALYKFSIKRIWWVILLFCVIFIGAGFLMLETDYSMGIFYLCIGVIFWPIYLIVIKVMRKRLNKSLSVLSSDSFETFTFEEDIVKIDLVKGDDYKSSIEAKYNYFYKVIETKTHYFFYIAANQSHVVLKSSITRGNIEEFNDFLESKLTNKFKRYAKK